MGGDPVRGRATPAGMDGRAPKRLRCVGCWRWSSRAGWPACWCRCTWSSVPASIWSGYPRSTGREVERITPVVNPSRAGWPALLGRCSCSSGSCQPGTRAGQDRRTRPAPSAGHQIEPRAAIRCGAVLPQRVGRSSARAAAVRLCCWRWSIRAGWPVLLVRVYLVELAGHGLAGLPVICWPGGSINSASREPEPGRHRQQRQPGHQIEPRQAISGRAGLPQRAGRSSA